MYFLKNICIFIIISKVKCDDVNPVVSVYIASSTNSSCTGLVVDEKFLLTTASCLHEPVSIFTDKARHDVRMIERHPEYTKSDVQGQISSNDLALLELSKPLKYGTYKPIDVENLKEDIYAEDTEKCSSIYWKKMSYSDQIEMKIVKFKNLTFAKCDESIYFLQNILNVKIQNICSKYILSYGESKENLQNLVSHSLPLFCNGQFFGFLSSATKKADTKIFAWIRASGYLEWLQAIINREHGIEEKLEKGVKKIGDMPDETPSPETETESQVSPEELGLDTKTAQQVALLYVASNLKRNIRTPLSPMTNNWRRSELKPEVVGPLFGWPTVYPPKDMEDLYGTQKDISTETDIANWMEWALRSAGMEWVNRDQKAVEQKIIDERMENQRVIAKKLKNMRFMPGLYTIFDVPWLSNIMGWGTTLSTPSPPTLKDLTLSTGTTFFSISAIIIGFALLVYMLWVLCSQ